MRFIVCKIMLVVLNFFVHLYGADDGKVGPNDDKVGFSVRDFSTELRSMTPLWLLRKLNPQAEEKTPEQRVVEAECKVEAAECKLRASENLLAKSYEDVERIAHMKNNCMSEYVKALQEALQARNKLEALEAIAAQVETESAQLEEKKRE